MKKILQLIFILLFSMLVKGLSFAHPMDTSQLQMYLFNDSNNQPIENNQVKGIATFNWLQFSALTSRNENPVDIYKDIVELDPMFITFIQENIKISNNNSLCDTKFLRINVDDVQTVIVDGIKFKVESTCTSPIQSLKIENNAFKKEIVTQLNTVSLFNFDKELTLPQESVLEYQTNYEEPTTNVTKTNLVQNLTNFFKEITNVTKQTPSYLILFVVYLVGILHVFEGGHNKIILGSLVINKKVNLKQAFIYTIIFTLTHISDIILLSIGLVILGRYIDIYSIFPNLRITTILILAVISFYWLFKEIRHIYTHKHGHKHHHHHDHEHEDYHHIQDNNEKNTFKSQLMIAFISGLAPCITGWSIFMLLFSSGRTSLMIPGNIVFGLGVFTVLSIYTLILMKTKNLLIDKFSWIGEYSNIISFSLIFFTSLIQIINVVLS